MHRRHLRQSQKAMCAAKMADLKPGEAGNSRSANLRTYSAEQAAELFGVSTRSVESARVVLSDGCPELIALCEQGKSVAKACDFIALRPYPQRRNTPRGAVPMFRFLARQPGHDHVGVAAHRIRDGGAELLATG